MDPEPGADTTIIIGELINASRKAIEAAIETQDAAAIQQVATDQAEAGPTTSRSTPAFSWSWSPNISAHEIEKGQPPDAGGGLFDCEDFLSCTRCRLPLDRH
ncbi:hypothetical protein [Desulfosarcina alkanivorans]|uniref:hypothetical protein n=1 Tax=Desulfosarcina alkanivorans TaxID=571177 RepID=UPI0018D9BDDC|nr:hypothetical protein [Desulfosarcina alkanivorans]